MRHLGTPRRPSNPERRVPAYADATFPMYVLPVAAVLDLGRIPPHEKVCDLLVEWQEGMETLFVTHTWLSDGHPDNDANEKLLLLQAFLRGAGSRSIHADFSVEVTMGNRIKIPAKRVAKIAFVFLDFWAIPQANRDNKALAIQSIPAYVARSSFF